MTIFHVLDMLHQSDVWNNLNICIESNLLPRITASLEEDDNRAKQDSAP